MTLRRYIVAYDLAHEINGNSKRERFEALISKFGGSKVAPDIWTLSSVMEPQILLRNFTVALAGEGEDDRFSHREFADDILVCELEDLESEVEIGRPRVFRKDLWCLVYLEPDKQ